MRCCGKERSGHQHTKGSDAPSVQSGEETVGFAAEKSKMGKEKRRVLGGKMESGTS